MNIIEAIKSGKSFRRKGYNADWIKRYGIGYEGINLDPASIVADDWEILLEENKPKKKARLYKWAYTHNGHWYESERFYSDEENALVLIGGQGRPILRLDYTMIEIEE